MDTAATPFEVLLEAARQIGRETAAQHAADVDQQARFPHESVDAMRRARLLSAPVPRALGGAGCDMRQQGQLVAAIAPGCASSAMVLAMHYSQVACLTRHPDTAGALNAFLRELCERQLLVASITSEVGTWGNTRTSVCAVQRQGDRFTLDKEATTGSYCAEADAILVTCRQNNDAAQGDQALVLLRKGDYTLEQTTSWDTLGMRGTRSPGFKLVSSGPVSQIFEAPFADIAALSMVPHSHILWSALWTGIAAGAQAKAASYVRGVARKNPGTVPPTAVALADLTVQVQTLRQHWMGVAGEFDAAVAAGTDAVDLNSIGWALKMNSLKTACSEAAPKVVHGALQVVGILGYKNDSPFSLGREYRDSLSASLMISNDRIAAKSAAMLLVFKDE